MWKVYFFQTARGDHPVKNFIILQNEASQARINKSIRLLINYGPFLKPPYIKKIKGKIFELRVRGNNPVRIFYIQKQNSIFLLHAFKKKSQKTPLRELKTAIDRSREII